MANKYLVSYDSNGDGNCLFWSIDIGFSQILKEYPNAILEQNPLGIIQKVQATRNLLLQAAAQVNPPAQVNSPAEFNPPAQANSSAEVNPPGKDNTGGASKQFISSKIYMATENYEEKKK